MDNDGGEGQSIGLVDVVELMVYYGDQDAMITLYPGMTKADLSDCLSSAFHLPPGIEPVGIYKMSKKPDEAGEETPEILRYITKTIGKAFGEPGSTGQALIPLSYLTSYLNRNPGKFSDCYRIAVKGTARPIHSYWLRNIVIFALSVSLFLLFQKFLSYMGYRKINFIKILSHLANISYRHVLKDLYREGPAIPIMGITIGFWDGLPQFAICSEITQSPEKFWIDNPSECKELVSNRERNFYQTFEIFSMIYILYTVSQNLLMGLVRKLLSGGVR